MLNSSIYSDALASFFPKYSYISQGICKDSSSWQLCHTCAYATLESDYFSYKMTILQEHIRNYRKAG